MFLAQNLEGFFFALSFFLFTKSAPPKIRLMSQAYSKSKCYGMMDKLRILVCILFASPLLLTHTEGQAMGLFDFFTIHVFSEVSGIVTFQGELVEGAKIIRTGDHQNDKIYTDTTTTDKDGKFFFKGISTFSLRPIMLDTVIRQKMLIKYQGMEYLAWETLKRNNHKYGELNDESAKNRVNFHLLCELTNPQDERKVVQFNIFRQSVRGLCRWEGSKNLVIKKQKEEP